MTVSRAEKRRAQKLAKKQASKAAPTGLFHLSVGQQKALDRAVEFQQSGQLTEAESIYRSILSDKPNHPIALHYLGLLAHQVGNAKVAIELIERSIVIMPDYVDAHCNLANVFVQVGQAKEAEASCRKAIAIEPDRASAYNQMGKALLLQGRFEEAAVSCRKALALNPDFVSAYETLGSALCELGKMDAVVETYHEAISASPHSALFHNNLGSAYHLLRNLEQAEKSYQEAIVLEPTYVLAYQNHANVLRDLERIDDAVVSLKKVLELAPELASSKHNLDALLGNTTEGAPKEYVEELFDQFANRFENDLLNKLEYKMPVLLKKTLVDMGLAKGKFEQVVDLGCGTGLVGVEFRDIAQTLIGIDLSQKMLQQAEDKGVYDQLYVDDVVEGLSRIDGDVDLFVCADVFIYVGALEATFDAVKEHASPNALFVFSTEHLEASDDFVLQTSSRYAHSKAYIEALSDKFGFQLEHFEQVELRKEKSGWIAGAIYVLKC